MGIFNLGNVVGGVAGKIVGGAVKNIQSLSSGLTPQASSPTSTGGVTGLGGATDGVGPANP